MSAGPTSTPSPTPGGRAVLAAGIALVVFGALAAGLVALVALQPAAPQATPELADYAIAEVGPAPALLLTDQDGRAFALGTPGRPTLVFFGYTHCPDVCPATMGVLTEALAGVGPGPQALFVSIDPERDDVAAMRSYVRFLPDWLTALTGSPAQVRENADRWGVKYARIDEGSAAGYAMAHTADVFLVDAAGRLRARFPFGTEAGPIAMSLHALLDETPVALASPAAPTPSTVPATAGTTPAPPASSALLPEVVSTSIWAREHAPVILRATDANGGPLDGSVPVTVQLARFDGTPEGDPVTAITVVPEGEERPSFIADLDVPSPGAWRLVVRAGSAEGSIPIDALDPGTSTPIGGPAPDVDTPTLDDVGGVVRAVTTQPNPDLRLSTTSVADARAAGKPYVIVIDSARFKVSPACGLAISMIQYLLDRWPGVTFVHLEPFEYQVITEEPVLAGPLTDPPLNRWAAAYGLGDATWPATEMPWIFVVDGEGTVRAKATGVVGTADVDVILTRIATEGGIVP